MAEDLAGEDAEVAVVAGRRHRAAGGSSHSNRRDRSWGSSMGWGLALCACVGFAAATRRSKRLGVTTAVVAALEAALAATWQPPKGGGKPTMGAAAIAATAVWPMCDVQVLLWVSWIQLQVLVVKMATRQWLKGVGGALPESSGQQA